MALLFSHVRVSTPDGNEAEFLVAGIPREFEDVEGYTKLDEFLTEIDEDTEISFHAEAYLYGEGETFIATIAEVAYGAAKFARYAVNVWGVDQSGKTEREVAEEGLCRMETWMKKLGLVMNLTELGVTPNMIDGIASATLVMDGGYKVLTSDEIKEILKASL